MKQMEEKDALLAAKMANETSNRLVFKKDSAYLNEQRNGIDRFVKKDVITLLDRSYSSSSSSSPSLVQSTSSSSPCKIKNRVTNGHESCTSGQIIQAESKPFNSSVRLSSAAGVALNSMNKRNKTSATSQVSSSAPKNGISSFFVRDPISAANSSSGAYSATSRDTICREQRIFLDRDSHDLVSDDDDNDSCPVTDTAKPSHVDTLRGRGREWERGSHETVEIDMEPSSSHKGVSGAVWLDLVDTGQKRGRETRQRDSEGVRKIHSGVSRTGPHAVNRQVRRGLDSYGQNQNQSQDSYRQSAPASHRQADGAPAVEGTSSQVAMAPPLPARWDCTACTYKNLSPLTTCEMCQTRRSH